jgi:probable rRNA maturation factor
MKIEVDVRNESARKRLIRRDTLERIAERTCRAEGLKGVVELSVLFCDDPFIQELNKEYRDTNKPTDVLSFGQEGHTPPGFAALGDVVISLETVERRCAGDRQRMNKEARLLFCHGLLHLLGYDHARVEDRQRMTAKQAEYLEVPVESAWISAPGDGAASAGSPALT